MLPAGVMGRADYSGAYDAADDEARVQMTFDLLLQQKYQSNQTNKTRSDCTFDRSASRLNAGESPTGDGAGKPLISWFSAVP